MRRTLYLVTAALLAASVMTGCGSDAVVVRVDGHPITEGDVEALLAGSTTPRSTFVGVMELLVFDDVLARTARDELGVTVSPDDVQAQIQQFKDSYQGTGQTYDEALAEAGFTLDFVAAQARIRVLALQITDLVQPDLDTWVLNAMRAADIRVDPDYGVWRTDPNPAIYPLDS